MIPPKKSSWTEFFTENLSYKLVSFAIALILWMTILGRRDFVYTKNVEIEFRTSPGLQVITQTADRIRVRVSGPRAALKRYMESVNAQTLVLDLNQKSPGAFDVEVPLSRIEVPLGVKILGVRPHLIRVELEASGGDIKKGSQ